MQHDRCTKNGSFCCDLCTRWKNYKEISADILDEESYRDFEPLTCVGDATKKVVDLWKARSIEFNHEIAASARGQVKLAFEKYQKSDFEDVAYFEPFYLKDFLAIPPKSQKSPEEILCRFRLLLR